MSAGRSALDGRPARAVALLVALLVLALLLWINRALFLPAPPPKPDAAAGDEPFARCMTARSADIDRMVEEGTAKPDEAELFRSRAEAMCRAEAARAAGGSPGLPPGMRPAGLPPGLRP